MNNKELMELHKETMDKCFGIMKQKNSDYTGGEKSQDPFANFRASSVLGVHPVKGILIRIIDKIQRINSFANDGELKVSGESVDDACEDIVNYAILIKAILTEQREVLNNKEV